MPIDPENLLRESAQALARDPLSPSANFYRGAALQSLGRLTEALESYDRALAQRPDYFAALVNRGEVLRDLQQLEAALDSCDRARAIDPDRAIVHLNRGNTLLDLGRLASALESYDRAISLEPDFPEAHSNRGRVLLKLERPHEALAALEQALNLQPDFALAHVNRGAAYLSLDRPEAALGSYDRALELRPNLPEAHLNRGNVLLELRRFEEAIQSFRAALVFRPGFYQASFALAWTLLCAGRYDEGWRLYEARDAVPAPTIAAARWEGQPIAEKSILLCGEQGFGDQIQFIRYASVLKELGAAQVAVSCDARLAELFRTVEGVDAIIGTECDREAGARYHFWSPLMSLPYRCKTTLETIPAKLPYVRLSSNRLQRWRSRLPDSGLKIGLVWRGSSNRVDDRRRSLPSLSTLAPLWCTGRPDVSFVSLQRDAGETEGANPPKGQPLLHLGSDLTDFADTAAIVSLLDAVICVDTAIAHLAGALNKRCWVMLPNLSTDWRWMPEGDESPWYPSAVRLFRQGRGDVWARVVEQIAKALGELTSY